MYFLNPQAFWAFFLLLIPIFIHLFNFRRVKKVYFSNLSFLTNVKQERKSRSTLKKILVLTARILALTFIVLAFSRPVFLQDQDLISAESSVIYVDNSLSMQRTDPGGTTLLTNALIGVEDLLDKTERGNRASLITNDRGILKWEPTERILDRLPDVGFSKKSTNFRSIHEKAKSLNPDHFIVFSDFQRSVSLSMEDLFADTSKRVTLYYQHSQTDRNLYIDSVYLDKPPGISGGNQLHIKIKNTGSDRVDEVLVKLFRGEQQLSSFSIAIEGKSSQVVSVEVGVNDELAGNYRVEIEDSPIVFDNTYYFAISQRRKPTVMVLHPGEPTPFVQSVFSNKDHFTLITNSIRNVSFQEVVKSDLLVLDHLSEIPQWLISQLNKIKGNILLIPGANIHTADYSAVLGLPVSEEKALQRSALSAGPIAGNPFFEGIFLKRNERMSLPEVSVKYRPSGFFRTLLSTNAGNPFLVQAGEREIFFLTAPLADSMTNFHKHALFVPVMYKLVQHATGEQLAHRLDEHYITVTADSLNPQSIFRLANTENSYIVSSRISENKLILEIPEVLEEPGIYHLISDGDTLRSVALNYNKIESEMETMSAEQLRRLISGNEHVKMEEIMDVQELLDKNNQADTKDSLWKYALLLALIFIISELLLLRFI